MADEKTYEKFDYKKIDPNAGYQKILVRFDKPQEGDSEFGHWILYGVEVNGVKASWFVGQEVKNLLTKLGVKRDTILMIKTAYYTKYNKDGEPVPDVYGILEWKGKEHIFGKETNGKDKVEPKKPPDLTTEEQMIESEQTYEDFVCNQFSLALSHVMGEMKKLYEDKGDDHVGFNSADVEKMVVSVFMALCNKR